MPAAWGWRVIYFLHRPPWVREEPIAAFYAEEHGAYPMVRGSFETLVVKVDRKTPYIIAAPGEPAESFVERAKEHERQHRRWLTKTREKRKEERRFQAIVREQNQRELLFERSGRTVAPGHPARGLFRHRFCISDAEFGLAASHIALAWFVAEHCVFGQEYEVSATVFRQRLVEFIDAYELPHLEPGAVTRALRLNGVESLKVKGKVEGWKGLALRTDPPLEACLPAEGEDTFRFRLTASSVFASHCIQRTRGHDRGTVSQQTMLMVFRTWCIRYRLKPWTSKELARELKIYAPLTPTRGPLADRTYQQVHVRFPTPDQSGLDRTR
jgi:hypothetical protein